MSEQLTPDEIVDIRRIAADIARELKEKPEAWGQGDFAFSAAGGGRWPDDHDAVCWCIRGHLWKRNRHADSAPFLRIFAEAAGLSCHVASADIADWNDHPDRTVQDIIAVCEKVANG